MSNTESRLTTDSSVKFWLESTVRHGSIPASNTPLRAGAHCFGNKSTLALDLHLQVSSVTEKFSLKLHAIYSDYYQSGFQLSVVKLRTKGTPLACHKGHGRSKEPMKTCIPDKKCWMNAHANHNNYWFRNSVYVAEWSNAKAKANYFQHSSENHSQSLIVLLYFVDTT